MKIVGNSDIGRVRKENQDAFWFSNPTETTGVGVVCDGMGGVKGGQEASKIAVDRISEWFSNHSVASASKKKLIHFMQDCNRAVVDGAKDNSEYIGMGTTMVLAMVNEQSVTIANIGDSRGYHITNGNIQQITKDHSAVQELVDNGKITERQARIHPNKNIITRALGIESEVEVDLFDVNTTAGDVILLCSDGLTNMVDESEIQFEVSGGVFEDLPQRLIDLANSRGGTDNITVVAIQI